MLEFPPRNAALERMRAGEAALGMIVRLQRTGDVAMIAAASGHDFIFLDLQHGTMSVDTATVIAQTAIGCGVAPIVRVGSYDDHDACRLLDAGAMGIVFPDIETAAEARQAVEMCRFAPLGKRSVSSGYPALGYRAVDAATAVAALEKATLIVCMIETVAALANIEEIARVEGVDVLHIGCNDMLNDMGKPGQFGDPQILAAIATLTGTCARHGKFAGVGGDRDLARQGGFIREGVRFLTTGSDLAFIAGEGSRRTQALRAAERA